MRVGVLGAWSIDNTGDAIIGFATRRALRARLPSAEILAFAPRFAGEQWRHDFSPARGLDGPIHEVPVDDFTWARDLDALVIGGGGIVNFAPAFRVFQLGGKHWSGPPVAWNGVCSQNTPAYAAGAENRAVVARCCEQLAYVSVRNATSLKFLRTCGYAGTIHVVPDAGFAELGISVAPPERFTITLSVGNALESPSARAFYDPLFADLSALVETRDADLQLLPFGAIYGDDRLATIAAKQLPRARVVSSASPLDLWSAIGASHLHITARLHGAIAAISQNVSFLALDEYLSDQMASSKMREMIVDANLEAHYTSPFITRVPGPKLAHATRAAGTNRFESLIIATRQRFDAHVTAMVRALGLPC